MRVLYITEYQGPAVVAQRKLRRNRALGAARKVELFASSLSSGGHDVVVLSTGAASEGTFRRYAAIDTFEQQAGTRVHYLPGLDVPRANMFYARQKLAGFLEHSESFDAVLLYNLEWLYLQPIVRFVSQRRIPLIIEYEDDALEPIEGARFKAWYRSRGAKAVALARKVARGVIAVSEELGGQLAIANSIVMPGAVGDDLLAIAPRRSVVPGQPLHLVYAGSLTRTKGVHELVSALETVDNAVLDIVGNGPELDSLKARASTRVIVHGEVSRERLTEIYSGAHVAVNPHIMLDAMVGGIFPFKIAEYVAAGLPVISTRLGTRPEPIAPAIIEAASSEPAALAGAIDTARKRYESLLPVVAGARRWIEAEYSGAALVRKLDSVLRQAAAA